MEMSGYSKNSVKSDERPKYDDTKYQIVLTAADALE